METLKQERRWCVRDQNKKPYMSAEVGGKPNDSSTWLSYEEANSLLRQYPEKFTGLGLYFSAKEGNKNLCLCGIDIDAIHHDAAQPNPLAEEVLNEFKGTYAERSPSKTGYHILFYVDMSKFPFEKMNYPFRENNREKGLEAYVGTIASRYFTYSGDRLDAHSAQVTDQTESFIDYLIRYMSKPQIKRRTATSSKIPTAENVSSEEFDLARRIELIRDSPRKALFELLFDKGDISKYKSASDADFALLCILVPWLDGNPQMLDCAYRESALFRNGREDKWDSKRGVFTYGERTIMAAINTVNDPYYSDNPEYATGDSASPEDIVRIINEVQQDDKQKDKVSILPFACGLGKSTAISYKIAEVLQDRGTDGLIVVTDSLKRMYDYKAPANTALTSLKEFLDLHEDEIFVLESKTRREEASKQYSCRVLIMSTQRYFQQLSREQIIEYTNWAKGKRRLILMDERPGVLEPKKLTINDLNRVGEALQSLQPRGGDTAEQDWCLEQWDNVTRTIKTDDLKYRRMDNEKTGTTYFFCQHSNQQMTDDDERFNHFICENSYAFYENKLLETIHAVCQFLKEWGIVECSNSQGKQIVRFFTLIDYQYKIKDIGAKVIILDGTAELSPEYDSDLYDFRQSPACRRWLDRLHLHLVNFPTTREAVKNSDPVVLAESIKNYAWRLNKGLCKQSVVFTYKAPEGSNKKHLETELKALFNNDDSPCNVDHFGAIRGKNDYNNASFIIQYGLLQYSRSSYMLYAIHSDSDIFERLTTLTENETSSDLKQLESSILTKRIRSQLILTDIEQNFFRGSIRMSDSNEEMDYHIFFRIDHYPELLYLMQLRYLSLHATITTQKTAPEEFKHLSVSYREGSISYRLHHWLLECNPGRKFTYKDIEKEMGITAAQISQARARHSDINDIFVSWQDEDDKYLFTKPKKPPKYNRRINQK